MSQLRFGARVHVEIEQLTGPSGITPGHVLNWLVAANQDFFPAHSRWGVEFTVCPHHVDPGECSCDGRDDARFALRPRAASPEA